MLNIVYNLYKCEFLEMQGKSLHILRTLGLSKNIVLRARLRLDTYLHRCASPMQLRKSWTTLILKIQNQFIREIHVEEKSQTNLFEKCSPSNKAELHPSNRMIGLDL